jgi:hypothetical protein
MRSTCALLQACPPCPRHPLTLPHPQHTRSLSWALACGPLPLSWEIFYCTGNTKLCVWYNSESGNAGRVLGHSGTAGTYGRIIICNETSLRRMVRIIVKDWRCIFRTGQLAWHAGTLARWHAGTLARWQVARGVTGMLFKRLGFDYAAGENDSGMHGHARDRAPDVR